MPRTPRAVRAGGVYHVLNRGNGRAELFHKPADFDAFLRVLAQGLDRYPVDLFAWCLMSNHWHLVLRPRRGGAGGGAATLARFMGWVGVTHVRRHHEHHHTRGGGHLYQGRFKSFPLQDDRHFLAVCRYVESNPLRAGIVRRAENWPHSSLRWSAGLTASQPPVPLAPWPVDRPPHWLSRVNEPLPDDDLERLRTSVRRGRPFGDDAWTKATAGRLGLTHTLRGPGRPRKAAAAPAGNQ